MAPMRPHAGRRDQTASVDEELSAAVVAYDSRGRRPYPTTDREAARACATERPRSQRTNEVRRVLAWHGWAGRDARRRDVAISGRSRRHGVELGRRTRARQGCRSRLDFRSQSPHLQRVEPVVGDVHPGELLDRRGRRRRPTSTVSVRSADVPLSEGHDVPHGPAGRTRHRERPARCLGRHHLLPRDVGPRGTCSGGTDRGRGRRGGRRARRPAASSSTCWAR